MSASFVSGEIGSVDNSTVVITFSEGITDTLLPYFTSGVTIRKNGAIEPFTAQRQSNHAIIYYTISTCDSDDVLSWEYLTFIPDVLDTNFAWTKEDYRK